MSDSINERAELRCIECERPVIMERGLSDPPNVICTDCEAKIDDAFWSALHGADEPIDADFNEFDGESKS